MGRLMLTLAAALRREYAFSFVCPPSPAGSSLLQEAAALGFPVFALDASADFNSWLSAHAIDLIHHHAGIGWEGHTGVYIAEEAGIPSIRTEHLPYLITDPRQQAEHQRLMNVVKRLVCVSKGAYNSFLAAGIDARKLSVVRNGIATPKVQSTRTEMREELVRQEFRVAHEAPLFLTVGRFTLQKNYTALLDAIPQVLSACPEARWLLVGTGPLWEEMNCLVQERDLTAQVHLLGNRNDVAKLMAAADAFVLPSLFEGLPLVVLEAMALKLPVIGTDVCGIAETVRDGVTGRLVPPADAAALAEAMCELLANASLRARWSASSHEDFIQHWTAQRMAADMQKVYDEVLYEMASK